MVLCCEQTGLTKRIEHIQNVDAHVDISTRAFFDHTVPQVVTASGEVLQRERHHFLDRLLLPGSC